jgi:hypothetical protein
MQPSGRRKPILKGKHTMSKKAKTVQLSEEQISQIADRIGSQHEQKPAAAAKTTYVARNGARKSAYFWGAASGVVLALAAPMLRPAMRKAVKGGIVVGRYAKHVASSVKEEFEDMTAEAQADLDKENNNNGSRETES